ncbi:hypothetical protein [Spirosoma aerolatum]|uniref:hypothetical protein n=1 Tax=Spirosoma aerolatum TaxID=1211326 RepID=UPI001FE7B395|nr:hypothetical protein [Spirosoma aerolatum]
MTQLVKVLYGLLSLCVLSLPLASAQNKSTATAPPSIVSVIESVSGKHFVPDTVYASLSAEDEALLSKEPIANWSLMQESGEMAYSNLVIGTRSYQLVIRRPPRSSYPTATLVRYTTPKSKPEPIVQGILQAKEEKPK